MGGRPGTLQRPLHGVEANGDYLRIGTPVLVHGKKNRELLVPERDGDALLQSINWLFDNPDAWPEFGTDNRTHCSLKFDHGAQAIRLATIYDAVTG